MADIKTRDAVKGTIKTIDKAAIATERMKSAYAKTKDKAEQGYYADENSATEYAADRLSYGADRIKDEGIHQFNKQGQKAVKETRENIGKAKDKISAYKQKKATKAAEQHNNGLQIRHGAASHSSAPDSVQRAKSQFIKTRQQGKKTVKTTARNAEKTVKATAKGTVKDVTLLKLVGFKPIIVHGGGKAISKWVAKAGKEPVFVNGLRVTDAETMEIAEMVLGRVNKNLVAMVQELGVPAAGISGKDGGLLQVEKKYSDGKDIGFVGDVTKVNPKILYDLIDRDYLPIVAPVGMDENFETYNINADDAACAIARAVGADKLVFLTDVEGLYKDFSDKSSFISRITASDAEALVSSGEIGGGMLPKLNNCTAAVKGGVNRVHILDGRIPHCLLLEIFTDHGIGTAIVGDDE